MASALVGAGGIAGLVYRHVSAPQAPSHPVETLPSLQAAHVGEFLQKYCFECHSGDKPEAGLGLDALVKDANSIGTHSLAWQRVAERLEKGDMPAPEATAFPTEAERKEEVHWVRASLAAYEGEHAGEPGRVTVRRLTSAEYAYAIEDLTGIHIPVPIDASSDSVGGEGFSNFGDVQFMQDANTERYLEAAKQVADHAVIGTGPLAFYSDPGRSGLELSAYARITDLYQKYGYRSISGEGGKPFGLERSAGAIYVAWYYQHRVALKDPTATLQSLAAKEGITAHFAEHMWATVNDPENGFPMRDVLEWYKAIPAPTSDIQDSIAKGRAGANAMQNNLLDWPIWFFTRGALAANGSGDETPLAFNDQSLAVTYKRHYEYPLTGSASGSTSRLGGRGGIRGPGAQAGAAIYMHFTNLNPSGNAKPVVIFRNAQVATYASGTGGSFTRGNALNSANGDAPATQDAAGPAGGADGAGAAAVAGNAASRRARVALGPPLSTTPLKDVLSPEAAAALHFGESPDGSRMGPNDFAITGATIVTIPTTAGVTQGFVADAEIGADRSGAVRLVLASGPVTSSRDAGERVFLAEPDSAGHKGFRAGIAEFLAAIPPNSQGEANPADKDPVPMPFDSTFNTPEHDAFVLKVKYQRADQFIRDAILEAPDRTRLDIAWNDLLGSFPYHDGYLQMLADHYDVKLDSTRIADMTSEKFEALPAEMRGYLKPIISSYQQVVRAFKAAEPGQVEDAITFASRAWRRPLTEAEKANLRVFYQKCRTGMELDHEKALRALLARVLVSPEFLYRVEMVASGAEKPLTGWEMASRLSFFLWSSIPDEELRRAAAAGELEKSDMLAKQVKRMIADPKSRRISTEFFGQWLGFYRFDEYRGVDTTRFPEFTEAVQSAMYEEAVKTFEYMVREGRPVKEIIDADYTFLNRPLATFYGIAREAAVESPDALVKVDHAKALDRGGALRLGSVLTVTSAPLRTSPVKRGDWVLRRILGTPTPTPPADAGSLPGDPAAFGGLTLRERLSQHKRNPTCATCHLIIDPLGFPLEGFDNLGRSRTAYADGKPVDLTGEIVNGATLKSAGELIGYLNSKDELFMRTLSRKMLGYALGRTVGASDQRLVDDMVAAGNGTSFADLAMKIVTSRQFRYHQGRDAAPAALSASLLSPQSGVSR